MYYNTNKRYFVITRVINLIIAHIVYSSIYLEIKTREKLLKMCVKVKCFDWTPNKNLTAK